MPVILKKDYPFRVESIDAETGKRLRSGSAGSFISIVPTKRKLRALKRELLRSVPREISPSFFLFTLETFAAELHKIMCRPRRFVSGPAQAVLINQGLESVQDSLRYFRTRGRAYRMPKGTFQKIVEILNTLNEHGVYPSALRMELESAKIDEVAKLQDILLIYEAYQQSMGEHFIDAGGLFRELNERWEPASSAALFKIHFPAVDAVMVSGFDEFSDPELTMLENVSNIPDIGTLISFDYHPGNDEIFGHLRDNYQKFQRMAFQTIIVPPVERPTFADHATRHLFRNDSGARKLPCAESITLLNAADREEEVETIAKIIKDIVNRNPDRDLSKICVATYRPQIYTNLFREVFGRYGIPANITDRYALDQSPFVVALLSLLGIQQNNYRIVDIMRSLSSPYFDLRSAGGRVDPGNLYDIAARYKIPAGQSTWLKRIDQNLLVVAEELATTAVDEFDEARLRREEKMLRKGRDDIKSIAALLSPFAGQMSPSQFKKNILSLLGELRVAECIVDVSPALIGDEQIEKDARAYQKFLQFLDEFMDILELEGKASIREPLSYYAERLRTAVSQVRYNIRQKYGYGVSVTSFDETRGLQFDVMIIAGLVDGECPPVYQPEVFFSAARRAEKEQRHLVEHRYLFYQALTNFSDHLYLTVPRCDGDVQLVPSSFLDALLKVIDLEDWSGSPIPGKFAGTIYCEDEFLQHAGRRMGNGMERQDQPGVDSLLRGREELRETLNHMEHAIRVERSRARAGDGAMPEYSGRIGGALSASALSGLERLRDRVYSVTQLESYGSCPFQFFADKVLRLKTVPEADDGVSPLERGGMLHEILFEFYTGRRERNLPPMFQSSDAEFQQAVDELQAIARRKLEVFDGFDIFWDVEKELILGSNARKGMIEQFLDLEREHTLEVRPAFFEVAFGARVGPKKNTDRRLTREDPIVAGNVRFRGKVDRIDVGENNFRIIDYKTGASIAGRTEIELGTSLQLPMYLYAVEQILSDSLTRTMTGAAGLYYHLKDPVEQKLGLGSAEHTNSAFRAKAQRALLKSDAELRQVIDGAIRFVNAYVDAITKGEFAVEPKQPEKICTHCSFSSICRIRTRIPEFTS